MSQQSNPHFDHFTKAVKTIVGVPKEAVVKQDKKLPDNAEMFTCPDCGMETVVIKGHKHTADK